MGAVEPVSVQFAFLSVGSPDLETAKERATSAGHRVVAESTVADTEAAIAERLATWSADPEIDVVLVLAGNDSDAASKALRPLVSEVLPGFTDLFRWLMFQEAGASAMLSSAEAAQCGSTIVFVLPGAIAAAMDKLILPQFDPKTTPRNLVAKLPRLRTEPSGGDAIPESVSPEKTQGGSGMPARLPAIPPRKQSRTGANVMLRVATEVDPPTKPIDLGRLEQELANSGESGNDDPTSVGMTMPALPPGADEDDTHTDTLAAPPAPAEPTKKLPSIVKPTGARGPNGPRVVVPDIHRTPPGPVPVVSATRPSGGIKPASKFPDEARTTVRPAPVAEPPTTARPKFVEPATTVRPKPAAEPPTTVRPKADEEAPTVARPKPPDEAPTVARPKPPDEAPTVMLLKPAPAEPATVVRPAPPAESKFVDAKRVQTQPGTGVTPTPEPEAEPEPQELEPDPEPGQLVVEPENPRLREPTPPPPTPRTRPPTAPPPAAVKRAPTAPPAVKRPPTAPPPVKPPDDLPRGTFSYPVKKRRASMVLTVLGLLAVVVLGFFAVVFIFRDKDEATPRPTPTPPVATPTPPPTPPVAEVTPTPPPTPVEPEIEIDPTPIPVAGSNAAKPAPPKPPKPPSPPKPPNAGSATPVAAPPPDAAVAVVDDDCDETSCILSKYDRPCCARYKPVTSDFKPHVGGTPDTLDKAMVKAGIEPIKPRVIGCGEKAGVKGTVKIAVSVSPDGAITSADVADSPDAALGQCVLAAMRNAKFGKSVNGASFTYPFAF